MNVEQTSNLQLLGNSASTRAIRAEIDSAARTNAKVLVTGETGVGKDVIARLIHERGPRRTAAMATVNCAGISDSLVESELFGHVRGSFTDAYRDKAGIFEAAANGTVFLDEIGEMSLRMQAVLLRFLETGEIQRVGADRPHAHVNVRIIAATNRDVAAETASGAFRQDLYYRLNVIHIHVPPLRERDSDIRVLLDHYLERFSRQYGVPSARLSLEAQDLLGAYRWPGNVRQLKNVVERLVLKCNREMIGTDDIPRDLWERSDSAVPRQADTAVAGRVVETAATSASLAPAELLSRILEGGESFWAVVHAPYIRRDLSRAHLKEVVARGLEKTAGNYRLLVELFNMPATDYKRFLAFLRRGGCQVPFQYFRNLPAIRATAVVRPTAIQELSRLSTFANRTGPSMLRSDLQ